ncbi:MAG: hypothetical protein JXB50_07670 [Spirochaetes bacterium]|nr:hypothetical protein [Spirochaetota bacterium]
MKKFFILIILLFLINNIYTQDNTSDNKNSANRKEIKKDINTDKDSKNKKSEPSEKKEKKKEYIIYGKTILVLNLNTINKIGIGFSIGGTIFAIGGGLLLIYDYFGFKNILYSAKTYSEYQTLYTADIALMVTGISAIAIGAALVFAAIPMILYKTKDKKTAVYLKIDKSISLVVNIKLDFKT